VNKFVVAAAFGAVTVAAPVSAASVGTSATFEVDGNWSVTSLLTPLDPIVPIGADMSSVLLAQDGGLIGDGFPGGIGEIWIDGSFTGTVQNFDPVAVTPYRLSASLTATPAPFFDLEPLALAGSFVTPPVSLEMAYMAALDFLFDVFTPEEIDAAIDAISGFIAAAEGEGTSVVLPGDGGTLFFAWDNFVLDEPTLSVSGDFELGYTAPGFLSEDPLILLSEGSDDSIFVDPLPPTPALFGTYDLDLAIGPEVIPLPPALPLLGFAVAGLWGLRRWSGTA